ncbi:TIGR03086 family metal-binding protein [Knoellia sp. 3-2P3]|uniref:TIGR03086 family metal-binding protein n=1 Tax=unclassified Knoellia TaxID=2618719 RepID=UPI0023DC36DD|nr:TIGR03086 family metal-binding protein [Knoellia sp. 3-2P3]MDF2090975.1 TIGR03086 family metal-binding protein [Knoellia sp. 3-2P3]
MSLQPGATPVTAGTELLERALAFTRGTLALVTPDHLERPTPCSAWRLRDLLGHMEDSLVALHDAAAEGSVTLAPWPPGAPGDEPAVVASLRHHGCALLGAWARLEHDQPVAVGGRPLPASTVAVVGALEVAVHGWDVARSCGRTWSLPEGLARELLRHVDALVGAEDRGVRFADPVQLPPGRPPSDRLLALTGRAPDWGA